MTIVNDDSRVINKLDASLTDDARVAIYNLHVYNTMSIYAPKCFYCGLYYKPMTIVNDDSRVVNKLEASLTDDARVIIYERRMFIVQATGE
jgi:hypothetical protein